MYPIGQYSYSKLPLAGEKFEIINVVFFSILLSDNDAVNYELSIVAEKLSILQLLLWIVSELQQTLYQEYLQQSVAEHDL